MRAEGRGSECIYGIWGRWLVAVEVGMRGRQVAWGCNGLAKQIACCRLRSACVALRAFFPETGLLLGLCPG